MKREENPGGNNIVTMVILGVGGYALYLYLNQPGANGAPSLWQQWFGGAGASAGGTPTATQLEAAVKAGTMKAFPDDAGNAVVYPATNSAAGPFWFIDGKTGAVSPYTPPTNTLPQYTGAIPQPTTVPPSQTTVPPGAVTGTLANQLQAAGQNYLAANPGKQMTTDLWLFYYQVYKYGANPNDLSTFPITGAQASQVFTALGIDSTNPSTRITPVTLSQFVNALGSAGVSGIIQTPGQGPIRSPLPTTQNFSGGYGGYGNAGRRGYLN